ncbi:MAG: xylulokinase [Chloroflexi bacterium RBG_16_48_8]|nr:MAG: xylulokinase [Chloroflexi bacterium RBG_16_48_8]
MEYVIGCDIGTQSAKVILFSFEGEVIGESSSSYDIDYPHPLWAEQPVERWVKALKIALHKLIKQTNVDKKKIRSLGVASQVDGVVPINASGNPLRPAIIWMDKRSKDQCDEMDQTIGHERVFRITGLNVDPSHVAPKIRWIAENQPDVYDHANYFLLPGSYITFYLTGYVVVDYSNASSSMLMDVRHKRWSDEMCRQFDIDITRLAPLEASTNQIGNLKPDVANELGLDPGTVIVTGCGDEHSACVGAGVLRQGLVGAIVGTGEAVCTSSADLLYDPTRLIETHCHADPDLWFIENPGFVSGGNYRWYRDNFAQEEMKKAKEINRSAYDLLDFAAEQVAPGSDGLIFLPCLMGAMTPDWNELARGTFYGLTLSHTRNHFARAILEGSAYGVRDITDQMQSMGLELQEIRVVGGGAKSRLWCQIKADVTGIPVFVPEITETTALGSAMLAMVGVGEYSSLLEVSEHVVRIAGHFEPRLFNQEIYHEYYSLYRQLYTALEPIFLKSSRIHHSSGLS